MKGTKNYERDKKSAKGEKISQGTKNQQREKKIA